MISSTTESPKTPDFQAWTEFGNTLSTHIANFRRTNDHRSIPASYWPQEQVLPGMAYNNAQRSAMVSRISMTPFQAAIQTVHHEWRGLGRDLSRYLDIEALPADVKDSIQTIDANIALAMSNRPYDSNAINKAERILCSARMKTVPLHLGAHKVVLDQKPDPADLFHQMVRMHISAQITSYATWLDGSLLKSFRVGTMLAIESTMSMAKRLHEAVPAFRPHIDKLFYDCKHKMDTAIHAGAHQLRVAHACTGSEDGSAYGDMLEFANEPLPLDHVATQEEMNCLARSLHLGLANVARHKLSFAQKLQSDLASSTDHNKTHTLRLMQEFLQQSSGPADSPPAR